LKRNNEWNTIKWHNITFIEGPETENGEEEVGPETAKERGIKFTNN
jgi:hypothetical protein